jgi:hypothetical protein
MAEAVVDKIALGVAIPLVSSLVLEDALVQTRLRNRNKAALNGESAIAASFPRDQADE